MSEIYDVAIIGGGPAGYTAGLYAARAGLKSIIIEKMCAGGQMTQTVNIDNYPGFEEGIDGYTLGMKMQTHAERFGLVTNNAQVEAVHLSGMSKVIQTDNGEIMSKTVVIATGAEHKHLGIEEEERYIGRGVGYCASCDGMLYKGKTVVVIGGGNSAMSDANLLSNICERVIIVHRRTEFRAEQNIVEALKKKDNVEFVLDSRVVSLVGDKKLEAVKVENIISGEITVLECSGMFISIGRTPKTEIFKDWLDMDDKGYIIANEDTKTMIEGVYAAGDVRTKPVRQIVTATADGATAVHFIQEYLKTIKE